MSEELTVSAQTKIGDLLLAKKETFQALLPKHVDFNRFLKSATLAAVRNPELTKCTANSVVTACVDAAELGLDFTPAKGYAFLVPYKGKAQFIPGYRGLIHLALQSDAIENIEACVVYQNDVFEYERGLNPVLKHKPALVNPGAPIGAYAIAWFKSGKPQYEFMTEAQINHVKKRSQSANSEYSPWTKDPDEMRKKTVVRRLFKYLPSSIDNEKFHRAVEADNAVFNIDDIPLAETEPETNSATDKIMNKLDEKEVKPEVKDDPKLDL